MQNSNPHLLQQLKSQKNNPLSHKCILAIQNLQQQLQRYQKINQEQKHLINIYKQGKEYYQNQYKNSDYQYQLFTKINEQNSQLKSMVNSLRLEIQKLNENNLQLKQSIGLKDSMIALKEQEIFTIQMQKQMIQKQWNKVVKAVKRKISKLQQTQSNHNVTLSNKQQNIKQIVVRHDRQDNKQNEINNNNRSHNFLISKQPNPLKSNFHDRNEYLESSLHERAINMVEMINQKLAIRQLENLFESSENSNKKEIEKQIGNRGRPLAQSNKVNQIPFTLSFY